VTRAALATFQHAILLLLKEAGVTLRTTEAPAVNGHGDQGDHSLAAERAEEVLGVKARASDRVAACLAALARISDGTYGTCLGCSRTIAAARLKALPTVATCLDCAARAERESDDARHRRPASWAAEEE
jgi:RNA polymerase-binding transcription factor DksA